MTYKLLSNASVGVIVDASPIFRDIKDTFVVSFILPDRNTYIALFRDESGIEYRTTIRDSTVKVPKKLLTKEQRIGLTVCQVNNDAILHSWECPTLRIGTFLSLRQSQWQITVGTDDKELFARLADIENEYAKYYEGCITLNEHFNTLKSDFLCKRQELEQLVNENTVCQQALVEQLANIRLENEILVTEYNNAIKVINDLSERVNALEKNYDPTVIK